MWKEVLFGPTGLLFLGGILSVLGAFWGAAQQNLSERKITAKNEELVELAKSNSLLSERIEAILSGKGSFPVVLFGLQDRRLRLSARGEAPITDVVGNVVDLVRFRANPEDATASVRVDIGVIAPTYYMTLPNQVRPISNFPARIRLNLSTSFAAFGINLALEKMDDGAVLQAMQIFKKTTPSTDEEQLIHEHIPEEFPRDSNGGVDFLLLKSLPKASNKPSR